MLQTLLSAAARKAQMAAGAALTACGGVILSTASNPGGVDWKAAAVAGLISLAGAFGVYAVANHPPAAPGAASSPPPAA